MTAEQRRGGWIAQGIVGSGVLLVSYTGVSIVGANAFDAFNGFWLY